MADARLKAGGVLPAGGVNKAKAEFWEIVDAALDAKLRELGIT